MRRIYSHILGSSIVRYQDGLVIGKVSDIIIDPDSGKIEALIIQSARFFSQKKILLPQDIIEWKIHIYVHDKDVFALPKDIVRIEKLLKKDIRLIKNRVIAKNKEYLGKVVDFSFSTETFDLHQIFSAKSFLGIHYDKRVIAANEIIEIKKTHITVKNNIKRIRWRKKKFIRLEELMVNMDPTLNKMQKKDSL